MAGRPILVTGAIRSGTTWVGRMIAESPAVGYIHEPFNPWDAEKKRGICNAQVPYWYFYVTKENERDYVQHVRRSLAFRYNLVGGLAGIRSRKDLDRVKYEYRTFRDSRARNVRPLVKDPFALFSAEWFAETFDMKVVIMVRHPAAFVSSIRRLEWKAPFWHLLRQPFLMRDYLHTFENQLRAYSSEERDIIDQAILLWRLLYSSVIQHRHKHPDWIFLRHEDISREPLGQFRDLFTRLDLDFTPEVESAVGEHSAPTNPGEVPVAWAYAVKRDSRSAILTWKERLTPSEIERIREGCRDVAKEFYSDADW